MAIGCGRGENRVETELYRIFRKFEETVRSERNEIAGGLSLPEGTARIRKNPDRTWTSDAVASKLEDASMKESSSR